MATVTALDLVNEVLRLHRFDVVDDFSDNESGAPEALLLVNRAIEQVLNSEDWPEAVRHDGVLVTSGSYSNSSLGAVFTKDNTQVTITNYTGENAEIVSSANGPVTRILATNSAQPNTPYRLNYTTTLNSPVIQGQIEIGYIDTTAGAAPWKTFAAEYALPSTVRGIVSVQYHESSLPVYVMRESARLDEVIPSVHDNIGGDPEWVAVGGRTQRTYTSGEGAPGLGLRLVIYPVPSTRYRLDYSYVEQYARLSDPTDSIDVTGTMRDRLVDWAYAHSNLTGIGNDPRLGAALKADVRADMARAKSAQRGSARGHRATIAPFGETGAVRKRMDEPITDPFA